MQILREEQNIIKSSNTMETSTASIEMTPEMFKLLSAGIYQHPERACIRELSTNGIDAHAMNGNEDRPLKVHLPSQLEPYFEVRDFGPGMTHEQIMNLYLSYGTSTKRDSNTQIGGFGIGSKSPFAIAQSFTVTVFQGGVKRQYSVYMENGIPQVTKLTEGKTDEEDGIAVRVAVSTDKIQEFLREAGTIYTHFPVKPISNREYKDLYADRAVLGEEAGLYKAYGRDQATMNQYRHHGNQMTVGLVMGNIEYPVKISDLLEDSPIDTLMPASLARMIDHLLIYVPIGSVSITASREALQLNDQTRKDCRDIMRKMGEKFLINLQADFDKCTDLMEVATLYRSLISGSNDNNSYKFIRENLTYQGKKIGEWVDEQNSCRHRQVVNNDGTLAFKADNKTPIMEYCVEGVRVYSGRVLERNKTRAEQNTWKEESAFTLFGATSNPDTMKGYVYVVCDRFHKNGAPKTTGNIPIFAGIMNAHAGKSGVSPYNCQVLVFDNDAELDDLIARHHYTRSKMDIQYTSQNESYYVPKKVVRGQVKVLVSTHGDIPSEVKVNLDEIPDAKFYLKAYGQECVTGGFQKGCDISQVARGCSKVLGKPVYIFRKATWEKIPEEWMEITPEDLYKALTPMDWIESNHRTLAQAGQSSQTREMTCMVLGKYNNRLISDGYLYKRDANNGHGVNLWDNFDAINEFFCRPVYYFARAIYGDVGAGAISKLLDILPSKSKIAIKLRNSRKKQEAKVKKSYAQRRKVHPLVQWLNWNRTTFVEVCKIHNVPLNPLTAEDLKNCY